MTKSFQFVVVSFIAFAFSPSVRANWVKEPFDPANIVDYTVDKCLVTANRGGLTFYQTERGERLIGLEYAGVELKRDTIAWDGKTQSLSTKVDGKYVVKVERIAKRNDLHRNIHDKDVWTKALRAVPFLSVDVTDKDGNDVQVRNFHDEKVNAVTLKIGNYNGTSYDLYASNMSDKSMIVIHDRVAAGAQRTYTIIVIHCGVDAVFR